MIEQGAPPIQPSHNDNPANSSLSQTQTQGLSTAPAVAKPVHHNPGELDFSSTPQTQRLIVNEDNAFTAGTHPSAMGRNVSQIDGDLQNAMDIANAALLGIDDEVSGLTSGGGKQASFNFDAAYDETVNKITTISLLMNNVAAG